jgi:hypothetical protein
VFTQQSSAEINASIPWRAASNSFFASFLTQSGVTFTQDLCTVRTRSLAIASSTKLHFAQ